jgi:hypothetical protein
VICEFVCHLDLAEKSSFNSPQVFARSSGFKSDKNQQLVFSVDSYAASLGGIKALRNPRWILKSFFHMNSFANHLSG